MSPLSSSIQNNLNAIITIAVRDLTKLVRDRGRLLAGLIFPAIFIGILGTSLQANLSNELSYNYLTFVFTGVIGQVLFQSTAAGMISLIEDRENDFAQELFISPISRYAIVIGKIIGETLVAFVQIAGSVLLAVLIGVQFDFGALLTSVPFMVLVAIFGGGFGLLVMSRISDQRTVNQLFPFLIFPQFFLAGVFNPIQELPLPLLIASRIAPMTYAVDLIRSIYYFGSDVYEEVVLFNPVIDLFIASGLTVIFLMLGTWFFVNNERNR